MAVLPRCVAENDLAGRLEAAGAKRIGQGKVRDTYSLPGFDSALLIVTTDRISIFDFVLPAVVPHKGEVLNALTVFWLANDVIDGTGNNHLLASGEHIDQYLPVKLQGSRELQARAMVVRKLQMTSIEAVVRGYLTGSAWKEYQNNGSNLWGHALPGNLFDGSKLPRPIFTPTTKSQGGHDVPIDIYAFRGRFGDLGMLIEQRSLELYMSAGDYSSNRGFIIADTKFEFGWGICCDELMLMLGDEVLTPDSSRIWHIAEWQDCQKREKSPPGWDKQPVRDYFAKEFKGLDPANPDDLKHVASLRVPDHVVHAAEQRYLTVFEKLTGFTLREFQKIMMCLAK
ncbi:phosphoribosylaminoimidazolesuccinocarboxamide synthase [bacterium]|nr:MAG: phosphoribosylaminoimidazolesuccinocarboxamide synthase [bacterium]